MSRNTPSILSGQHENNYVQKMRKKVLRTNRIYLKENARQTYFSWQQSRSVIELLG